MQLSEVADSLYGLPPDEFTKARDAAVRDARSSGDKELAADLKDLRRPPVSAWAVNVLARQRREPLDDLLALGAELREAQAALAGDELRALSSQRHRVIASLTDEARKLVFEAGHKLADPAAREVSATLEAALADESAAAAVRSGRLMRALSSTGLEPVELMGAVAAPNDIAALPAPAPRRAAEKPKPKRGDSAKRLEQARTQAREAQAAAHQAAQELESAEATATAAAKTVSVAQEQISELTEALRHAKDEHSAAEEQRRRADKERDAARSAAQAAHRAADQADAALARLTDAG